MAELDVRWIQRFNNFKKALFILEEAINIELPSVVEQAGIVQLFEMTFELSWKLLKDYQELKGAIVKYPRDAIKQAFQSGLIENGYDWLEALEDRNLMAHTYNEPVYNQVVNKVKDKYIVILRDLKKTFQSKLESSEEE